MFLKRPYACIIRKLLYVKKEDLQWILSNLNSRIMLILIIWADVHGRLLKLHWKKPIYVKKSLQIILNFELLVIFVV